LKQSGSANSAPCNKTKKLENLRERKFMKKILENVLTIAGGLVLITGFLAACGEPNLKQDATSEIEQKAKMKQLKAFEDKFVIDTFKISEVNNKGEVRGEIIDSTANGSSYETGEGIYLLKSEQASYQSVVKGLHKGDVIEVAYLKKDYKEEVWDNILDVEKVK
jgi:hypothetical protein